MRLLEKELDLRTGSGLSLRLSRLLVVCTAAFFKDDVCVEAEDVQLLLLHIESVSTQSVLTMQASPSNYESFCVILLLPLSTILLT